MTTEESLVRRELQRLRFEDFLTNTLPRVGCEQWTAVYHSQRDDNESFGIFCALLPVADAQSALDGPQWEERGGFGMPGEVISYAGGSEQRRYYRFGSDDGHEPLVCVREFHSARPSYLEISEEFRHYFNLYEDKVRNVSFAIDDAGDEEEVVRLSQDRAEIRLRFLKEFLAVKGMVLAVYFDATRFSELPLDALGLSDEVSVVEADKATYQFYAGAWQGVSRERQQSFARLLGKKIITGSAKISAGEVFEDFIIGTDDDGLPVSYSCDHDQLGNYFGANPEAPHYLTPVFFRRDVLNKYFANPRKYSVEDGYLRCSGLWGLQIDNNHHEYVIVYLGDLGRDLPSKERSYWKSFNVAPEGGGSEVNFRRSILGQFTSPVMKDLLFKEHFERFQNDWFRQYGWDLFKPLSKADQHYAIALRIPLSDEQSHFDDQVMALVKMLIDSINENELQDGFRPNPQIRAR